MKLLGDDAVFVPLAFLDGFADFLGVAEFLGFFLELAFVVQSERGVKAAVGEDAAEGFAVANAGVTVARLEVGLISADAPAVVFAALLEAAILDAAVAGGYFVFQLEDEIFCGAGFPNDEGVALRRIVLGGLAGDGAVFDAPEFGIAVPAFEGFPVKDFFKAFFFGNGLKRQRGDKQNGD